MKILFILLAICLLFVGCVPVESDSKTLCESCVCDCPKTKMEDLDFFGTYYSPCVQYVTDLKELYNECGNYTTVPDMDTCVWHTWNNNGAMGVNMCLRLVDEIAKVNALPEGQRCSKLLPESQMGTCEFGVRL